MEDHLKEREIIDFAKKTFTVCLQKQVSEASFFDGCRLGKRIGVSAYRRIGVSAYRRVGV